MDCFNSTTPDSDSTGTSPPKRGRKPVHDPSSKRAAQLREAQRHHQQRKAQYIKDLEKQVELLAIENKEVKTLREKVEQLEFEVEILKATGGSLSPLSDCRSCLQKNAKIATLETQSEDLKKRLLSSKSPESLGFWGKGVPLPIPNSNIPTKSEQASWLIDASIPLFPAAMSLSQQPVFVQQPVSTGSPDTVMDELDVFLNALTPRLISSEEIYGPSDTDIVMAALKAVPSLKDAGPLVDELIDLAIVSCIE
ncbi:UNVERIFIED_CONTAM: hypothetical protein HDU68_003854 [Siphonaria sp. JEL0065]|nr:hypothetical protein HDU68_003854 [Siphonaria sp. JEL0065]